MYIYDLDLLKAKLSSIKTISNSDIISEIIKSDSASQSKINMDDGEKYYCSNNTIIHERNFEYFTNGRNIKDEWRSNNKLPHGFLKTLIDQKVNYSFSKPVILTNANNISKVININDFIRDVAKESCKKAIGWLHIFINNNNELDTLVIDSEEIIPIYDSRYQDTLMQVIRYYSFSIVDTNGNKINRYKVEVWDAKTVTFYEQDIQGNFIFDSLISVNPSYHWNVNNYSLGELVSTEGHSWGRVPFIPLYNNKEALTDLVPIKAFIDCYDITISDFANNIEDFQEAIMKLINYGGMTDRLDEFMEYVKKYKVIPLDENGNVEYMKNDIPFEARDRLKNTLRDSIFEFGQGVDINKVGDGNITNVVILNRYAALDLKANDFEANVTKFLNKVFWFANEYLKFNNKPQDDIKAIEVIYNRSLVINNLEIVDMCMKSKGIISDKTIISNHPWVTNIDEEMTQMDYEEELKSDVYFDKSIDTNNTSDDEKNLDDVKSIDKNENVKE